MIQVAMTAGIVDGEQFERIHYPGDEILLRVTSGGNVQVVEYFSTDRDVRPCTTIRGTRSSLSSKARWSSTSRARGRAADLARCRCCPQASPIRSGCPTDRPDCCT